MNPTHTFLTDRHLSILPNETAPSVNNCAYNLDAEYHQSKIGFEHLFDCKQIEESNESMGPLPNIQQDHYFIASTDELPAVGIGGLGPCFGVAFFGENTEGKKFFGGAHQSLQDVEQVLSFITNELLNRKCTTQSIEFYVVGGWLSDNGLDMEKEFFRLSKTYPIKGLCFNLITPDLSDESSEESNELSAVDVVIQANKKIVYSLDDPFSFNQDVGLNLPE